MSEIKVYGLDSSLIHDADPKDGFVVDVVRFSDYAELEKKYLFIVGETSRVIGERNDIRAAMHRAFHYLMLGRHVDAENAIKCVTLRGEVPTPATTQALNEIKAQGVEEQVSRLEGEYGELDDVCVMVFRDLREFAASLRGEHEIKS
ncbi:TPA: hypothetical protein SBJ50_002773 [Yersinia enterocolitica]|nr:hypothetical protein [Yersinia enterocolitica]HDL8447549.1 hypothetical protein [Yersinia enterocolitica]HEF8855964.1 hypothetical protein [Yersinia enterocolitica]HEN3228368.1 hypothetical protein [Yersinia enterocolitica]HEN3381703.1 hypothetical protein [Yersinia enterocolitica]